MGLFHIHWWIVIVCVLAAIIQTMYQAGARRDRARKSAIEKYGMCLEDAAFMEAFIGKVDGEIEHLRNLSISSQHGQERTLYGEYADALLGAKTRLLNFRQKIVTHPNQQGVMVKVMRGECAMAVSELDELVTRIQNRK